MDIFISTGKDDNYNNSYTVSATAASLSPNLFIDNTDAILFLFQEEECGA